MQVYHVGDRITVLRGTKEAEPKYRHRVSAALIKSFGRGPFPTEEMPRILRFCQSFYVEAFINVCQAEKSFTFYKEVFMLNEMATNLRRLPDFYDLPDGLDQSYVSVYRRILKFILEQGCDIDMVKGEKRDKSFISRITPVLNDLLYLGEMMLSFSTSYAEQSMVEDISEISFDENDLYVQSRRHHYEPIFRHISEETAELTNEVIIDENGIIDFDVALKESFGFGVSHNTVPLIMAHLYHYFKMNPPRCLVVDKQGFIKDGAQICEANQEDLEQFLDGMTLSRHNKMALQELVIRPHSIDRFLYRPLLQWVVHGTPFYACGIYSYDEAQNSLVLNAIPWGKAPKEWSKLPAFQAYINRKKKEHDKWLDDVVETIIKETASLFDRSVKKVHGKENSYDIEVPGIGEIDFLILSRATKRLYVTECKHLQGRYDMINWKNDYSHFVLDGKAPSYNSRIKGKVDWIEKNKKLVEEHFQKKYGDPSLSLDGYTVEGVFVVNTPTFYMYNCLYRIYTFNRFKKVLTGEHVDPTFSIVDDRENSIVMYNVKFPYFRKPILLHYNGHDDDTPCDKYGYPINR